MLSSATLGKELKSVVWLIPLCFLLPSCDESLPTRIEPQNTLEIGNVLINQGTGPAGIFMSISIKVQNSYEETFDGAVDVKGNIRIWWKQRPEIEANLPISRHIDLQLDPGESYFIDESWFLETDDGKYVLELLDFSQHDIRYDVLYARPEVFVLEVKVTLFKETGLLTSGPHEFTLQGWKLAPERLQP